LQRYGLHGNGAPPRYRWHGAAPPQGQLTPLACLPAPKASRAAPPAVSAGARLGAKGVPASPQHQAQPSDS
jgi:hypothetical protein